MSSCSVMIPIGVVSAMSLRDIGGDGPPSRDSNQMPLTNSQSVQSVRRKLFGDVDHQQTNLDLQRELRQCEERDRNKYNFDFTSGEPINLPDSRYEWSQTNPEVEDNNNIKLLEQQISTKISDNVIANTSQFQSESSPSTTSSTTVSSSLVLESRPTSATFSPDSQSLASSSSVETVSTTGHDGNQTESRVKTAKQSTITAFFDGRKSAESQRKRSAAMNVSHKDSKDSLSKRHRLERTSAVALVKEDTDTTGVTDTDEDSVQTTGTPV